jgi:hypothetical protein
MHLSCAWPPPTYFGRIYKQGQTLHTPICALPLLSVSYKMCITDCASASYPAVHLRVFDIQLLHTQLLISNDDDEKQLFSTPFN